MNATILRDLADLINRLQAIQRGKPNADPVISAALLQLNSAHHGLTPLVPKETPPAPAAPARAESPAKTPSL